MWPIPGRFTTPAINSGSPVKITLIYDKTLNRLANRCALAVMVIALLVMAGWLFGIDPLKRPLPHLDTIKFNTALGLLLAGTALRGRGWPLIHGVIGMEVALLGLLTLTQYLNGTDFHIDQYFISDIHETRFPGRMSPVTAICFLLSGLALTVLGSRYKLVCTGAEILAISVGTLGLIALVGYTLSADLLYQLPGFPSISVPTAFTFMILAAGILSAQPESVMAQLIATWQTQYAIWLGFGLLTFWLLVIGVASVNRLKASEGLNATSELYIAVTSFGLNVRAFAQSHDLQYTKAAAQESADLDRQLADYAHRVNTGRQQEPVARFATAWRSLKQKGQALMSTHGRPVNLEELKQFGDHRLALEKIIKEEIQPQVVAHLNATRTRLPSAFDNTETLLFILLATGAILAFTISGKVVLAVRRGEAALRDSEEQLRLLVDGTPDYAILMIDPKGLVVSWSPGAERITGYRSEEIMGRNFACFHPQDMLDNNWPAQVLEVARSKGRAEDTGWRVRKDGSRFWADTIITALRDGAGNLKGFSKITRDLTERMHREHNQVFLADLQTALIPVLAPADIMRLAGERIAGYLDLQHCSFVEIDNEDGQCTILHDHHAPDAPDLAGAYQIADFHPDEELQRLRKGETLVVADVQQPPRSAAKAAQFAALGIGALVNASYVTEAGWKFALHVSRAEPTVWPPEEITLLTELATRIFLRLERARTEETLRQSEAEFRSLAETVPQIVWATRPDGWNIFFNQRWMDYTGLTLAESYGHGWIKPFHPDDQPRAWQAWQRAIQYHETYVLEGRLRRADGSYRWWLIRGEPMRHADGTILKWFGTCTDIEDIKQAEERLRLSEQRWRVAMNMANLGAWELNLGDHTAWRSLRHDQIFGYANKLPEWTYEVFLQHVLEEDRTTVDQSYQRAQAQHQDWNFECRIRRADGALRWIWVHGKHLMVNQPALMFGLVGDITERKLAEESLKNNDQRKDEFLAMLGHELRNPLTPISNVAQILQMRPLDEPTLTRLCEILSRNVTHISQLVDDLLDVSRITRGLIHIQRQRVELTQLLKDSAESVQALAKTKQQTLNLDLPAQPVYLEGDPVRLTQVFTNLLNNAAKYTGEGGRIDLRVGAEEPWVVVCIQDNGMGIEPQLLPHIFELFLQGERGLVRSEGGLGIGLTLVRKLVDLHGGQVTAYSTGIAQGSEFVVKLPRVVTASVETDGLPNTRA
jgi:PAS domain S-box-containing protein